jgi:hypothetical protein
MTTPNTEVNNPNQGFESTEYSKGTKTVGATFYGEAEDHQLKSMRDKPSTKKLSDADAQAALDSALKSGAGAVGTALSKMVGTKATQEEIEEARKNGTLGEGHDAKATTDHSTVAFPATKEEIEEARKNGTLGEGHDAKATIDHSKMALPTTKEEVAEARKNGTLGEGHDAKATIDHRNVALPATKEEVAEARKNGTLGQAADSPLVKGELQARPATKEEIEEAKKYGTPGRDSAANVQMQEARPATAQEIEDARKNGTLDQGHDVKAGSAPNEELQKLLKPYVSKDDLMLHRPDRPPTSDPNDTLFKDRGPKEPHDEKGHMSGTVKGFIAPDPRIFGNPGPTTKGEPISPEPNW